jgi:hypothetical protein
MLTHITLDAEALMSGGWPTPSADLENLVASCQALGIPILLSSATLTEIETVWLERTGDRLSKARNMLEGLQRDFDGLVRDVGVPTNDALRDAYLAAVDGIRRRWDWQLAPPPPAMTVEQLVELSAAHQPPFRGTDTGFRDSYICMSVVLAAGGDAELGLVTADNALGNSGALTKFGRDHGVTVRRFRSAVEALQTVEQESRSAALAAVTAEIEANNLRLLEAARADGERLAAFVREHLEVPQDVAGGLLAGRVHAVRGIEVAEITEAHAGILRDNNRRASVTVALNLELEFKTYVWRGPMGLKQGEREDDMFSGAGAASGPRIELRTVPGEATVNMLVTWPEEDRELPAIDEYLEVEYGDASAAMTRKFTRLLMERG